MHAALVTALLCVAADVPARYGVEADPAKYPQATAKEALASALKAIAAKDFKYLAAHIAEAGFVDGRVKGVYAGKFDEQVSDTESRLDALAVKQLARFAKDGKWKEEDASAVVTAEEVPDKCVRLVKKGGRWFLSHRFDLAGK